MNITTVYIEVRKLTSTYILFEISGCVGLRFLATLKTKNTAEQTATLPLAHTSTTARPPLPHKFAGQLP